jgi:hypothetical protein
MRRLIKLLLIAVCIAAAWHFIPEKKANMHDLAFENIEALANKEGSGAWRFGTGTVDCLGRKVELKPQVIERRHEAVSLHKYYVVVSSLVENTQNNMLCIRFL